jgi:hypothetical protein
MAQPVSIQASHVVGVVVSDSDIAQKVGAVSTSFQLAQQLNQDARYIAQATQAQSQFEAQLNQSLEFAKTQPPEVRRLMEANVAQQREMMQQANADLSGPQQALNKGLQQLTAHMTPQERSQFIAEFARHHDIVSKDGGKTYQYDADPKQAQPGNYIPTTVAKEKGKGCPK